MLAFEFVLSPGESLVTSIGCLRKENAMKESSAIILGGITYK